MPRRILDRLSPRIEILALLGLVLCSAGSCSQEEGRAALPADALLLHREAFDPRERPLGADRNFIRLDDASSRPEFSADPPSPAAASGRTWSRPEDFTGWVLTGGDSPDILEGHPAWRVKNGKEGLISPPLDIPFRDLRAIEIRFTATAGTRMRLWWSPGDTFADKGWSVLSEIRPEEGTLRAVVRTASLRGFEGLRLSRLRFDPTDGEPADVSIESIRLIGREGLYDGKGHGLGQETLGNELRHVIFQRAPARLSWQLTVPPRARLEVGAGMLDLPADLVVTATVETTGGGGRDRSEVFRDRIGDTDSWHDLSADLSRWEGQPVRLTLEARSSRTSQVVLWSNPVVLGEPGDLSSRPPNVIVYLVDTLRPDRLGAYGGRNPASPVLDRLAAEGVLFERCSATACWTRPSVASILTSLSPPSHGVTDHGLAVSDAALTLAEQMRRKGYVTAGFLTSTHPGASSNLQQGYDHLFELPAVTGDAGMIVEGRNKDFSRKNSSFINLKLFAWLDRVRDRPFFLYLHAMDPHAPYLPPEPYDRMFTTGYAGPIGGGFDELTGFARARTHEELDHVKSLYDGDIRYNDDRIGELLDELQRRDLRDRTLIVVLSDHGEEFFEHGAFEHGQSLHRELLDIPLIMMLPGSIPAGARIRERVSGLDVMPTILELAGVEPDADAQGRSLVPLIRRDTGSLRAGPPAVGLPVFSWRRGKNGGQQVSIERDDFHLILLDDGTTRFYDRSSDRDEQHESSAERPELARSLALEARAWLALQARVTLPGEEKSVIVDAEERKWLEQLGYVK